ncbi:FAD-dependent oxidoreductase [Alicyclobacillus dauci]|uniref:FAD-dependent oxidoreductase n=1 Tax=Alicyclobacillus dauci TaxID=1475485 RepID=A0ABY6Z8J1_9BACL|nr:FAD-dependent oxidoreductase [Alicyclobacillus dauci]WAH39210.1 FAD-dependent oxidoreductase [Alicyclobacillus dauci]
MHFDVVVVGGGSAGVAAAIGAANSGVRTILIEKNPYFGGAATHSSVLTVCGLFAQQEPLLQVVGGVANQFLDTLQRLGAYPGPFRNPGSGNVIVPLDAEATKYALDQCVVQAGVTPRLHCNVTNVVISDGSIQAVQCFDHSGSFEIEAAAFVDASGEGDLTSLAGGKVRFGDDEGQVQAATLVMRIGGVPADASLSRQAFADAVHLAKAAGDTVLTKEKGMAVRLPGSGHILAMFADEVVNGLDSASLTKAEMSARNQAWHYLDVFRSHMPGFEQAYLVQTGPSIGVRETRHVKGHYTLTGEDALNGVRHEDVVARGGWPVEIHQPGQPAVYRQIKDRAYYDIPLRSLDVEGIENLWSAGRIIDCDPVAFASSRVMGTSFGTGHAAGVAAGLYAAIKHADIRDVQEELRRQGAYI